MKKAQKRQQRMIRPRQKLGPNQRKWLKALESRKYKQTRGCLQDANTGACCCLGVACLVLGCQRTVKNGIVLFGNKTAVAPKKIVKLLGLHSMYGSVLSNYGISETLSAANDKGSTFAQIAKFCRKHPEAVFVGPR